MYLRAYYILLHSISQEENCSYEYIMARGGEIRLSGITIYNLHLWFPISFSTGYIASANHQGCDQVWDGAL